MHNTDKPPSIRASEYAHKMMQGYENIGKSLDILYQALYDAYLAGYNSHIAEEENQC